jgi:hypothetical protein
MFERLAAEFFIQRFSILVVIAGIVLFIFGREHPILSKYIPE